MRVLFKKQYSLLEKTLFSVQNPCCSKQCSLTTKLLKRSFSNKTIKDLKSPYQISTINISNCIEDSSLFEFISTIDKKNEFGNRENDELDEFINTYYL